MSLPEELIRSLGKQLAPYTRYDELALLAGVFIGFFSVLTVIYSFGYMHGTPKRGRYYTYLIGACLVSVAAVVSSNLLVLIVLWGFLGLILYLMIGLGEGDRASATAKKAFIIIGGTDALMLLGLALIWNLSGKPQFAAFRMDNIDIPLTTRPAVLAYLCLFAGVLAKIGVMPFHSWVPDTAEDAPAPVTALLPASLDKLVGIYFLLRMSMRHSTVAPAMFQMRPRMMVALMAIGSFTIVAAAMMALVQRDMKRMLGYDSVSQAGYMVIGIGTGTVFGIAGALFHMLNYTICKSCLFFSAGAVEKRVGTTDLEKTGGLAKTMPLTFVTTVIAALAIAGVPPLNGFASKWMVFRGTIDSSGECGPLWVVWLAAAMLGSALTLAVFVKMIYGVFLGQPREAAAAAQSAKPEGAAPMGAVLVILASLCVVFGVFAMSIPFKYLIHPTLSMMPSPLAWNPALATLLLFLGVGIGALLYLWGTVTKSREVDPFVGGENLSEHPQMATSGVDAYKTIEELGGLRAVYALAHKKALDPYDVGTKTTFLVGKVLGFAHNGVLSRYLAWCLLGMLVLLYVLWR